MRNTSRRTTVASPSGLLAAAVGLAVDLQGMRVVEEAVGGANEHPGPLRGARSEITIHAPCSYLCRTGACRASGSSPRRRRLSEAPKMARIPASPGPLAPRAPKMARIPASPGPLAPRAPKMARIPASPGPLAPGAWGPRPPRVDRSLTGRQSASGPGTPGQDADCRQKEHLAVLRRMLLLTFGPGGVGAPPPHR